MESLIDRLRSGAEMSLGEKLLAGVEVSVFAMVVVFAVLILLMFIVKLMGSVMKNGEKKVQAAGRRARRPGRADWRSVR